MSRYVTVQTKVKDYDTLLRVLEDMQVEYEKIKRQSRRAIRIRNNRNVLVLTENDSGFFTASGSENLYSQRGLLNRIQQEYAKRKVVEIARSAGFSLSSEKTTAQNEIVLELTQW